MFNTDTNDGSWVWLLVILLVLFGGFGGNNNMNHGSIVYGDTPATTTEVYNATNNQSLFNKLDSISNGITANGYENAQLINSNANMLNQTMSNGFDSLSRQLSECCCNLKEMILTNRLADTEKDLSLAQTTISNAVQTQNLLSSMGRWLPYAGTVNPYCGGGTTIA